MGATRLLAASGVLLVLSLAGCGGDDRAYPDSARRSFLSECREQIPPAATEETCACVLEEIERTLPYEEFRQAESALRGDGQLESDTARKLQDAINHCRTVG
jgi:hypothetical protein